MHSPGGVYMTSGEWKLMIILVIVACVVRFWRISTPNSVVCVALLFARPSFVIDNIEQL